MNKKRVWFPGWAEVLAHEPWPASQREAYRRVTARYLHECKERRWAVNVASARRFIETVEQERKPPAEKLAAWKEALNWFFKVARESGAQKDSTPHPPAHLQSQCAASHPACGHLLPRAEKGHSPVEAEREGGIGGPVVTGLQTVGGEPAKAGTTNGLVAHGLAGLDRAEPSGRNGSNS